MTTDNRLPDISSRPLTVFNVTPEEQKAAWNILISGLTPKSELRTRPGRGGKDQTYVNVYFMTRVANLVTGWRWTSKVLEESARPNWDNPKEVGAHVQVTIWDNQGNEYSHDSWGQKDVSRYETVAYKRISNKLVTPEGEFTTDPKKAARIHEMGEIISIFDDRKAAISDGIKKALSYFGIADDIYGGKEIELYLPAEPIPDISDKSAVEPADVSTGSFTPPPVEIPSSPQQHFIDFITEHKLSFSRVLSTLGIRSFDDIKDYPEAERQIAHAYSLLEK
jgi:hypothetical protein